ncbi:MAG: phosphoglycerate mutase family protein [Treponemataceae bacterium]|nr:phosphoglycerate mutase family protein [Treponemataceae bacterium]
MTLILLRHGQTAGNKEKRYIGTTDEPLSPEGRESLMGLKAAMVPANSPIPQKHSSGRSGFQVISASFCPLPDIVFSSPMKRCLETASILFPEIKPVVIDNFRETDFGLFEGKNYQELMKDKACHDAYQKWIDSNGSLPFPGGESREAFEERTKAGFVEMLEYLRKGDYHTAVAVVHGGSIMALLSSFLGGSFYDYKIENGGSYCCTLSLYGTAPEGLISDLRRIEL